MRQFIAFRITHFHTGSEKLTRKYQKEYLIVSWVIANSKGGSPDSHFLYIYMVLLVYSKVVHLQLCTEKYAWQSRF